MNYYVFKHVVVDKHSVRNNNTASETYINRVYKTAES